VPISLRGEGSREKPLARRSGRGVGVRAFFTENDWLGFAIDVHALTPSPSEARGEPRKAPRPPQWERGWGEGILY